MTLGRASDRLRRGRVDRAVRLRVVQNQEDQSRHILMVNPAHELLAGADRPADEHLEGRQHLPQRTALRIEYHPGPHAGDTDAGVKCGLRCLFPVAAQLR